MLMLATAMLAVLSIGDSDDSRIPETFIRAFEARMKPRTALISYHRKDYHPGIAGRSMRFDVRISGDDLYWRNKGDEDGIRVQDAQTGRKMIGVKDACADQLTIWNRATKEVWSRCEGSNGMLLFHVDGLSVVISETLTDPRCIGLYGADQRMSSPMDMLRRFQSNPYPTKWTETIEENIHVLKQEIRGHDESDLRRSISIYTIDPEKDYAILEINEYMVDENGKREHVARTLNTHEKFDGRWWIKSSESVFPVIGGSNQYVIEHAEFDRPEHPKRLDPDLWEVPPGVMITSHFRYDEGLRYQRARYIGGGGHVEEDQWQQIQDQYDNELLQAFWQRNGFNRDTRYPAWWNFSDKSYGLDGVEHQPDLWEAYVRRWIIRHTPLPLSRSTSPLTPGLRDEQVNAAWAILKDCRKSAAPIVERMRKQSESDSGQGQKAAPAEELKSSNASNSAPEMSREEQELAAIFEKLKQRLPTVLSTKQQASEAESGKSR
ncbi:MAG: hypothetical protein KF841_16700 [Phycisphaerae bacterium]|nr:hypothetical protein [Phycisphaerae bacterium]